MSAEKLPPVVRNLGWVSLFTDAASDMMYPLLPAFLMSLGAGPAALGVVEGVAEGTSALVKWLTGKISDGARRRKPFVLAGYGVATFVRPLLAFAMAPWHVVIVRSIDRFGKGLRSAPRDAIVAQAISPERRGAAFGFHRMMDNTGAVIGPAMGFALAKGLGWPPRWIFAFAIVPGFLALITLVFGVREPAREGATSTATATPTTTSTPTPTSTPTASMLGASASLDPRVRRYLAIVALFTLGASADSFLILRLMELGLSVALAPIAWLTLNAAKAVTNIPGGRLSDRFGRRRTLVLAWLVYGVAYAAFPLTRSIALTWALLIFYGVYYGLAEGGEKAIVADLAPAEQRGRAFGALHAITGIAILPANLIFGALYAQHASWAFGASAACALGAAAVLALTGVSRAGDATSTS